MATASQIAEKKTRLAAIREAFNAEAKVTNAANAQLDAAIAAGDAPELAPVKAGARAAVLALNEYGPKITQAVAVTDAMVPDAPPPAPPTIENLRVVSG